MRRSVFALLCYAVLSALAPVANAQENPPKHIRFLALGERVPWKGKLVNGVRVGQLPPKWEQPPNATAYLSGDQALPFQMHLRTFTKVLKMEANTKRLDVLVGDKANELWFSRPIPAAPLSLAVLYPDPVTMRWDKPKVLLLDDDAQSFKPGEIRFVNVSDKTVLVKLGKTAFGIAPGKSSITPINEGKIHLLLAYRDGKNEETIRDNQISVLRNQRVQVFFYKARKPVQRNGAVLCKIVPEPAPKVQ